MKLARHGQRVPDRQEITVEKPLLAKHAPDTGETGERQRADFIVDSSQERDDARAQVRDIPKIVP